MSNTETVRYSILLRIDQRDKLNEVAKRYKVTQPEMVGVLIDTMNEGLLAPHFTKIRHEKEEARAKAKSDPLLKKFKTLTPEQRAKLEEL